MKYVERFVPKEKMDRFPLDKRYTKYGILFRKDVRIVHYPNDELPTIWYDLWFRLDWPWRIKESDFKPYYPKLYHFFTEILGIKKPYVQYKDSLSKEDFERKFSIELEHIDRYLLPC